MRENDDERDGDEEEEEHTMGEPLQATIISSGLSRFTTAIPHVPSHLI